jgi:hypothetical protein
MKITIKKSSMIFIPHITNSQNIIRTFEDIPKDKICAKNT